MTGDQANEFAKRELRVDIGRKGAEAINKAALADSKFEGDYARIMTTATPAAPAPAPQQKLSRRLPRRRRPNLPLLTPRRNSRKTDRLSRRDRRHRRAM